MGNYFDVNDNWELRYNYSYVKAHYSIFNLTLTERIKIAVKAAYNIITKNIN
jgi:hypothetical protein